MFLYPPVQIIGKNRLEGKVHLQGSKGSAVLLAASIFIADEPVTLANMPSILDIDVVANIAHELGHDLRINDRQFRLNPGSPKRRALIPPDLGRRLRITPSLAAAVLAKEGEVQFPLPGGDAFCPRPIDQHLAVMEAAGATIEKNSSTFTARLPGGRPTAFKFSAGTRNGPSLGVTVTALLLASRARGTSLITEPSPEPEVEQVIAFLRGCGVAAHHRFDGAIEVVGGSGVLGTHQVLPPDRLEAGTLAIAAALTGGSVTLVAFPREGLPETFWSLLREAGAEIETSPSGCVVTMTEHSRDNARVRYVRTAPHPGFPTDLQPQATVLATQMSGITHIHEGVHELRSSHAKGLQQFGARVATSGRSIVVTGATALEAAEVVGEDIRCVVAYMLAALAADGCSTIHGGYHLRRGHSDFVETLRVLGAEVHQQQREVPSHG
ncbi:UDP-N-acetylglucosamine 1-carboxyvinyltransferase (plasmid) [Streptomyces anulatus]|uniref:UDP-N-acetylglucosamine 1-carboxyvinyltransferase n=1 Tax=Streptomyces anulatus TaxID=1892 RepID=UPI002F915F59|nr:UDP-N-acetylglucosamine 1-carboxyvinyltransferase [Streptomyces anulatus]